MSAPRPGFRVALPRGAVVSLVALVIAVIGFLLNARQAAATFLVAYASAVSVVLGALAMMLIARLTTATWFGALDRRAELVTRAMPALAGLGVLVLLSLPVLYRWVGEPVPSGVGAYLNAPFFIVRFIVYWIAWIAIARALRASARLEARGDFARAARRYRVVSAAGLVALGVTMTFAAFDWIMSLAPDWYSTIFGVYWFAGGMVGALALLAVLASPSGGGATLEGPREPVSSDDVHALAKLMLTFILFWLYIGFAQYIVIWSGGLPREVAWYVPRTRGGWGGLAVLLVFGNFVLPFLLLLIRAVRRNATIVATLGVGLLALHYLDTFWLVMPGLVPVTWWTSVLAAAMLAVVAALTIALTGWPDERVPSPIPFN